MPKVFISSVIDKFQAFRAAARRAVELMGDRPIMSEEFGARPTSSRHACLAEIAAAEVFVLILGGDFGSEAETGISVVQAEFHHAKTLGRPILVFVQKIEMDVNQAIFRKEVEDFNQGFFRASFISEEELKDQIIKGLRQLGQAQAAVSEATFIERIKQSTNTRSFEQLNEFNRRDEPLLRLTFLPQPARTVDIVAMEQELDEIFQTLCNVGLASLRVGYEPLKSADFTGLKTGKSGLLFFEDGLIMLFTSPVIEKQDFNFSSYYVSPSRITNVSQSAFPIFEAASGWYQLHLSGMEYKTLKELPVNLSGGHSMSMRSTNEFGYQGLLIPCTQEAYAAWVKSTVGRLVRFFETA